MGLVQQLGISYTPNLQQFSSRRYDKQGGFVPSPQNDQRSGGRTQLILQAPHGMCQKMGHHSIQTSHFSESQLTPTHSANLHSFCMLNITKYNQRHSPLCLSRLPVPFAKALQNGVIKGATDGDGGRCQLLLADVLGQSRLPRSHPDSSGSILS